MTSATRHTHYLLCLFLCHSVVSSSQSEFNFTSVFAHQLKGHGDPGLLDLYGKPDDNTIPSGFCKTWMGTVVAENATWEEAHCRHCRCDGRLGAVCQDPHCDIAFHPYLDTNCEEVSNLLLKGQVFHFQSSQQLVS